MIRLLIFARVGAFKEALAESLSDYAGIEIAWSGDADGPAPTYGLENADVALVDVSLPDSLPLIDELHHAQPGLQVVALGLDEEEAQVISYVEAGIAGYAPSDASVRKLAELVYSVQRGESPVSPRIAAGLIRRLAALAEREDASGEPELTPRERQIAELLQQGLSNKEIGSQLEIALPTVKNHVHNILAKLHLHRRGQVPGHLRQPRARD